MTSRQLMSVKRHFSVLPLKLPTYIFHQFPLVLIQLGLRILGQHLDVVVDHHDGEEPASSEQHGDIAVEGEAIGQHYEVWFELRKYFK